MITDVIRKATDQHGTTTNDAGLYPWLILPPIRECVTWAQRWLNPVKVKKEDKDQESK